MTSKKIILTNIIVTFVSLTVIAQQGNMDSTFAEDGIYLRDLDEEWLSDIVVQPDNKIIGSIGNKFMLLSVNQDGSPNTSFGNNGVTSPFLSGNNNELFQIALQADNKIVGVGNANLGIFYQDARAAIFRFSQDGSPDLTFGDGGIIINDIILNDHDLYTSIAIQANGKIIAGGSAASDLILYCYNQDGTLDASFGSNGHVTIEMLGAQDFVSLAIQPDGRIVASTVTRRGSYFKAIMLLRFNDDGSLDSTFADQGIATTEIGAGDDGSENYILLQQDGKIVFGGFSTTEQGNSGIILRYNSDGSIDSTFAQNGQLIFDGYSEITSIALQQDGKILASIGHYGYKFCRLNTNGSFDQEFGDNGWVFLQNNPPYDYDKINSIAIQHGGKILTGGIAGLVEPNWYSYLCIITRYNSGIECPEPFAQFSYDLNDNVVNFIDQSSSATNWLWDFGDSTFSSEQNPSHIYSVNGIYLVCLNITDTCGASQFCDTIIIQPTLINEPECINFRIYPNPFSAFIKLEFHSKEYAEMKIEILNIYGVKILEKQLNNQLNLIDTKNLTPGIYELCIRSNGRIISEKILKINY